MIYELIYTSAPAGLRPGSSGYCTVQSSRGIPAPTVDLLESLSGYRHVFTAGTPEAANNPVNYGHYILRVQGRPEHVLSRVSDCPLDHTGRSNKLGHHMVIDTPDAVPAGPAWLLQKPGWMTDKWDGQVTVLNSVRSAPSTPRAAGKCEAWRRTAGDAGWAGVLAESFLADPQRKVFLIYQPGTDILALFEEALALLPVSQRWDVTFSTYGAALPATVECLWSGVIAGSQEEHLSKRFVNALRIDLTKALGAAPEMGKLVTVARTGSAGTATPVLTSSPPIPAAIQEDELVDDGNSLMHHQRRAARGVPSVPPPVKRRAKKKETGIGRLALIVVACCLLFGGGMAAGILYFYRKPALNDSVVHAEDLAATPSESAPAPPVISEPNNPRVSTEKVMPHQDSERTENDAKELVMREPEEKAVKPEKLTENKRNNTDRPKVVPQDEKPLTIAEIPDAYLPRTPNTPVRRVVQLNLSDFSTADVCELMFPEFEALPASNCFKVERSDRATSITLRVQSKSETLPIPIFELTIEVGDQTSELSLSSHLNLDDEQWSLISGAALYLENQSRSILLRLLPGVRMSSDKVAMIKTKQGNERREVLRIDASDYEQRLRGLVEELRETDVIFPEQFTMSFHNGGSIIARRLKGGGYAYGKNRSIVGALEPCFFLTGGSARLSLALVVVDFMPIDKEVAVLDQQEEDDQKNISKQIEALTGKATWDFDSPDSTYAPLRLLMKYSTAPEASKAFKAALATARSNVDVIVPGPKDENVPAEVTASRELLMDFLDARERLWNCQKERDELLRMKVEMHLQQYKVFYTVKAWGKSNITKRIPLLEIVPQEENSTSSEMKEST